MTRLLKRFIPLLVIFFTLTSNIFAQDAVSRALDLINKNLILGDYDRSYSYAKFVANYYENEEIPSDVLSTIREAVSQRADNLVETGKYEAVLQMEEELKDYPSSIKKALEPALTKTKAHFKELEEEQIRKAEAEKRALEEQQRLAAEAKAKAEKEAEEQRLKAYYEEQRKIELEKAELERKQQAEQAEKEKQAQQEREEQLRKEALERENKQRAEDYALQQKQRQEDLELQEKLRKEDYALQQKQRQEDLDMQISLYEQQRAAEEQRLALEKQRQEADEEYRQQMSLMLSSMNESSNTTMLKLSKNNKSMIIFILVIVIVFVCIIVFVVFISIRQLKNHQEQMKDTIMIMQAQSLKSSTSLNETLPLLLQMQTLSLAANNLNQQRSNLALEDNSSYPKDDKSEITDLINNCKKFGKQIDETSGRKNVSMRVADLVLKISQQLGHPEYDCILYYAASLVYDIGFLNIDTAILKSGTLTEAQFKVIQTHPALGEKMLFFVNEKFRPVFIDAVSKHHENLDGTGYPKGLKDEEIPYIARVLRVAESYIALISNRTYKEIRDCDSAIAELRNLPNHYDQTIVDALDAIL